MDLVSPQKPVRRILEPKLGSGSRPPSPSLTSVGKTAAFSFLGGGKGVSSLPAVAQKNTSFLEPRDFFAFSFKTYKRISSCRFKSWVCGNLLWQQAAMRSWRSDSKLTGMVRPSHYQDLASVATYRSYPTHTTDLRLKTYGGKSSSSLTGAKTASLLTT